MARRLGISKDDVFSAARRVVSMGDELTVAAVATYLGCQPPSIYHHAPGGLPELQAHVDERVTAPRLAQIINDEGWTCEGHEPEPYAACQQCVESQTRLAKRILSELR